jgi:hypothetical protein
MQQAPRQTASKHLRRISNRFVPGPIAYLPAAGCSLQCAVVSIVLYVLLIVYFRLPGKGEQPLGA